MMLLIISCSMGYTYVLLLSVGSSCRPLCLAVDRNWLMLIIICSSMGYTCVLLLSVAVVVVVIDSSRLYREFSHTGESCKLKFSRNCVAYHQFLISNYTLFHVILDHRGHATCINCCHVR
uniref:Uncharacterized protein n=1 Tax=Cacopsylla melanoneura TaxID=428564 RepID=A0A8D8PPB4_9HEMI